MIQEHGWTGTNNKDLTIKSVGNNCMLIDVKESFSDRRTQIIVNIDDLKELMKHI